MAFANVMLHFQQKINPDGPWAPLKPATWARKKGPRELWETGALIESYSYGAGQDYAEVFSAGVDYAKYHDRGTENLPVRSFLWLDERVIWKMGQLTAASLTWSK